jgi:uncharacterized protein YxeA
MKKILVLLTACVIASVAYSVGENCYQINNADSKNYCLATAKQEKKSNENNLSYYVVSGFLYKPFFKCPKC